jgi:hypothetical protein
MIWSYSQHFHAEARGEEVIEHLLSLCTKATQRNMLGAQLLDERKHVQLFRTVTDKVGLDHSADSFSKGYVKLVQSQKSLSEKIFCFQILTESVSAAFCRWRLTQHQEPVFKNIDLEVLHDEERHMSMGHCLLSICDQDEKTSILTAERRKTLVRDMASICNNSLALSDSNAAKTLTRIISKGLVAEARHYVDA